MSVYRIDVKISTNDNNFKEIQTNHFTWNIENELLSQHLIVNESS